MTATDERPGLQVGGLLAQLARVEHERDELRAAYLDASDAIDLALAQRAEWFADGYRAGYAAGVEVGNGRAAYVAARCAESHDVGWHSIADHEIEAGQRERHAALDRQRYPPDGRVSWLRPRLGDLWAWWSAWCDEQASYDGDRESEQ